MILFETLDQHDDVPFKCAIEGHPLEQTVSLTIKHLWENSKEDSH